MRQTRTFDNAPGSVPAARQFVSEVVEDVSAETLDTLALTVSEVASNCVRHTGDGFELTVIRSADEVRVEATDRGTGEPQMRFPKPTDTSGRGLQIIDMLSTRWGVERRPSGKTVWFTIDLPAATAVES